MFRVIGMMAAFAFCTASAQAAETFWKKPWDKGGAVRQSVSEVRDDYTLGEGECSKPHKFQGFSLVPGTKTVYFCQHDGLKWQIIEAPRN